MSGKRAALERLLARPIAHRGLHGCGAPGKPVENTIGAAEAAIAAGFGIECDVQLSADGDAMVFHDEMLDRLTTGTGRAGALTARDLAAVPLRHGGERIPTLQDFLDAIAGRTPLVIEIKIFADGGALLADHVLSRLERYAGAAAIESFDTRVVEACLARKPPCPVGLVGPPENGEAAADELCRRCDFLSWNIGRLPEIAAKGFGVPLTSWTVRTAEQQKIACACGAQIVFEGFVPSASDD